MNDGIITLADGTQISMQTGRKVQQNAVPSNYVAVPSNAEAVQEITHQRRRLSDLPDIPEKMNTIGVIVAYHMFGLADHEIAHATGLSVGQVERIKMTDAFEHMHQDLVKSALRGQSDNVRSMIEQSAMEAVTTMKSSLASENEQVRVVAAKDILDRAGHRPNDVVEHRHKIEGGLTIEYVRKDKGDKVPTIDITPTEDN